MKGKAVTYSILSAFMITSYAYAALVPSISSPFYSVYDLLVNDIIKGPIGYVGGLLCIAMGGRQLIHYNYASPGPPFFGLSPAVPLGFFVWVMAGAFMLNADSVLVSAGTMI